MSHLLLELEQQRECRGLVRELEQHAVELEQQCRRACGLRFILKVRGAHSGAQG